MLVADRPVAVFPAPVTDRGHCTGKPTLGRRLPNHLLAVPGPSPNVVQAQEVEVGSIRFRVARPVTSLGSPSGPEHLISGRSQPGMLHAWTRAGSRRFPGDPSYAFALLQDPG
jgi:hypothetical protein